MSSVKILRHDFGTFYHFRGLTKMFGNWLKLNMICNHSSAVFLPKAFLPESRALM